MKRTITRTALATIVLLLSLAFYGLGQTPSSPYYDVYICGDRSVKLRTPEENTLSNGDKVHWFDENDNAIGMKVYNGTPGSTDLEIPATLAVGLHQYRTRLENTGGCLGDPSNLYTIYKLPTKQLTLTSNRIAYCAEESNTIKDAIITATTTPISPTAGFEYAYTWSVTKDGTPYLPLSEIGSSDNSKTNVNNFTMSIKDKGTYVFSASVKYVKTADNGSIFVAADNDGCSVSQTATQTVIVTPKPTKPTIELVP